LNAVTSDLTLQAGEENILSSSSGFGIERVGE
jgi:hypothetical protein